MVMALTASLRAVGTEADVVWFVYGRLAATWNRTQTEPELNAQLACLKPDVHVFSEATDKTLPAHFQGLLYFRLKTLTLSPVGRKLILLDSDMLFTQNSDALFCAPEGSFSSGAKTPYNAGLNVFVSSEKTLLQAESLTASWSNEEFARRALGFQSPQESFSYWNNEQGLYFYLFRAIRHTGCRLKNDEFNDVVPYQGLSPGASLEHYPREHSAGGDRPLYEKRLAEMTPIFHGALKYRQHCSNFSVPEFKGFAQNAAGGDGPFRGRAQKDRRSGRAVRNRDEHQRLAKGLSILTGENQKTSVAPPISLA